jgi:polysaccharide pyruvyl transferase WcaK-like protein
MRILIDTVSDAMRNKGNVALLQVAAERLAKLWPDASIEVITSSPYLLKLYCPDAQPVSPYNQYDWTSNSILLEPMLRKMPSPFLRFFLEVREEAWYRWPTLVPNLTGNKLRSLVHSSGKQINGAPKPSEDLEKAEIGAIDNKDNILKMLNGIDLFVVSGAQHMSDPVRDGAFHTLERLELATQLGIPTAMVGQGIGPIHDLDLFERAKEVLPRVNFIFVREAQSSVQLLKSLGVDSKRIVFTGDDAVELAYMARKQFYGPCIGLSVRIAEYTRIENDHLESIRKVLSQKTKQYHAPLLAIPISYSPQELDDSVLRRLFPGTKQIFPALNRFETPIGTIHKISRCRLMVTGTFHAAVFALAQGIPVVGLAKSEMYMDKFNGLASQFGEGCQVLHLEDKEFSDRLDRAIDEAWSSAARVRPMLLQTAARQIEIGNAAYRRIHEVVESKKDRVHEKS